jgi:hypothetical protein
LEMRRTASSGPTGPVFKGRAKLVSGASPFDAVNTAPANTADKLFCGGNAAPSGNNPFGAAPGASGKAATAAAATTAGDLFGNNSPGTAATAANPFAAGPGVPFASAPTPKAPVAAIDAFSAPPPGAGAPSSVSGFNAAPPSSTPGGANPAARKVTKNKSLLSASDVFSTAAPVEAPKPYAALVDPFSPPTAPGVKAAPKLQQQSQPSFPAAAGSSSGTGSMTPGAGAGAGAGAGTGMPSTAGAPSAHPFAGFSEAYGGGGGGGTTAAGAGGSTASPSSSATPTAGGPTTTVSSKPTQKPAVKAKKVPPPGMIATPHGYVPIASLTPGAAPPSSVAGPGAVPGGPGGPGGPGPGAAGPGTPGGPADLAQPLVSHSRLSSLVVAGEGGHEQDGQPTRPQPALGEALTGAGAVGAGGMRLGFDSPFGANSTAATATAAATAAQTAGDEVGAGAGTGAGPSVAFAPAGNAFRNKRMKPPSALVAFGFGGKVVTMIPRPQVSYPSMSLYGSGSGSNSSSGAAARDGQPKYSNGPLRVQSVISLLEKHTTNREATAHAAFAFSASPAAPSSGAVPSKLYESSELCKLLQAFPGTKTFVLIFEFSNIEMLFPMHKFSLY